MSLDKTLVEMIKSTLKEELNGLLGEVRAIVDSRTGAKAGKTSEGCCTVTPCQPSSFGADWHPHQGKYVIVRSGESGVHAGILEARRGNEYYLRESRRLWSWQVDGKGVALSGVAVNGIDAKSSKVDEPLDNFVHGVIECMPCSDKAEKSIRKA